MGGETGPIAQVAVIVSKDLLKWFRWGQIPLKDRNFDCVKADKHARADKKQKHTHPTDVVFFYVDPYLNKRILFNTDLKSYAVTSIKGPNVRSALRSLAHAIDCARVSEEWKARYSVEDMDEIRGLLFVYNHDAEYDGDFERYLLPERRKSQPGEETADLSSIPLEQGQLLHLIEPRTISYLQTILIDVRKLHMDGMFPSSNYYFYYPDQKLHKVKLEPHHRPATVESMCGPYLIVGHDPVIKYDETSKQTDQTCAAGFVVYYNRPGKTHLEFMYLFDVLSSYQILSGEYLVRIRVAHHAPHAQIQSHFKHAIKAFVQDWGFDDYIEGKLNAIEFEVVDHVKTAFSQTKLGWDN